MVTSASMAISRLSDTEDLMSKLLTLAPVFLLTSINTPVHTQLEYQEDEATFVQKDLAEVTAHIDRDPERNAAIFNVVDVQVAVFKKGDEYLLKFDLEYPGDNKFDGEGSHWTLEQAISAAHNPEGPEPIN